MENPSRKKSIGKYKSTTKYDVSCQIPYLNIWGTTKRRKYKVLPLKKILNNP